MNFLFEKKYQYIRYEPVDDVASQLKAIIKTPWYDLDINLSGQVFNDHRFRLKPKFSLLGPSFFNLHPSIAILIGRIEPELDKTRIHVTARPSHLVLFTFYFMLCIVFFSIIRKEWMLAFGQSLIVLFIRSLIHFSSKRLLNRFEREMLVKPEND